MSNIIPSFLRRSEKPVLQAFPAFQGVERSGVIDSVHYYEAGPEDAPITVVFVHGFTLAASSFYHQSEHLSKRKNVRTLLVDLRGHGETGEVPFHECSVGGAADDVARVIEQRCTTGDMVIVGHSLGGLIALNLARRYGPKRVRGLVLISTAIESLGSQGLPKVLTHPIMDKLRQAVESAPEATEKYTREAKDYLAAKLAPLFFNTNTTDYDIIRFHAELVQQTPMSTFIGYFDDLQSHNELDAVEVLQNIPGIVLVGDRDRVTPVSQSERICELWPSGELRTVKEAGHMLLLETPEEVNAAIDAVLDTL